MVESLRVYKSMDNQSKDLTVSKYGERNASSSAFGWDFQVNAAILLMAKNMKHASEIKIEGNREDIEILLSDGKKLYVQAKATQNPDNYKNQKVKLRDALASLYEACDSQTKELIYVTNSNNPLDNRRTIRLFSSCKSYSWKSLPNIAKEIIEAQAKKIDIGEYSLDIFHIQTIPFEGDDKNNRYRDIQMAIGDLLAYLGINIDGYARKILGVWQEEFRFNTSAKNSEKVLTKNELIWDVVAFMLDDCLNQGNSGYLDRLDTAEQAEVRKLYSDFIESKSADFRFYNRVVSDYERFREGSPRDMSSQQLSAFIDTKWEKYLPEISNEGFSKFLYETLTKLILNSVLVRRVEVEKMQHKVGLK